MLHSKLGPKLVTIFLLVFAWNYAQAGDSPSEFSVEDYFQQLNYGTYSQFLERHNAFNLESQPVDTLKLNQDVYGAKTKSTKRAFLYSLILPGAGEFYAESKLKAAAFLGLEALFWVGYFNYDGKGDDKKTQYRALADSGWDANKYRDYLIGEFFEDLDDFYVVDGDTIWTSSAIGVYTIDSLRADTARYLSFRANDPIIYSLEESLRTASRSAPDFGFTHHSVGISQDEFYENIGKYDQFSYGWGGSESSPLPAIRALYLGWRNDANGFYDKAKWAVAASLANHVLSAIDAALTVKRFNRKQDRFSEASLRIRMVAELEGISPRAVLTLKFQ